jgi:hypothetical protein
MNDNKQNHHLHEGPDGEGVQHHNHPYWKRAHRDWRAWAAVLLMIACMIIYLMSDDLSFQPGGRLQQRIPALIGE